MAGTTTMTMRATARGCGGKLRRAFLVVATVAAVLLVAAAFAGSARAQDGGKTITANDETVRATTNVSTPLYLTNNDTGSDGIREVTIAVVRAPSHGTVSVYDSNQSYRSASGYTGPDSFDYRVCDAADATVCDTATATINVTPRPPESPGSLVANDDSYTVRAGERTILDVRANDADADGDAFGIFSFNGDPEDTAPEGTLVKTWNNRLAFTPPLSMEDATYTFNYIALDEREQRTRLGGDADRDQDDATVTITVEGSASPPVARDDEVSTRAGSPVVLNVFSNDSDPEGGTLTLTDNTQPSNGTVDCGEDGRCRYVSSANYTGTDAFEYTVSDPTGATDTATATVTVAEPPPPPPSDGVSMPSEDPGCALIINSENPDHYDANGNNLAFTLNDRSVFRVEYERVGSTTDRQEVSVRIGDRDIPTGGSYDTQLIFQQTTRGPVPTTEGNVQALSYAPGEYRVFVGNVSPTFPVKVRVYACSPPEPSAEPLEETLIDASGSGSYGRPVELRAGDRVRIAYALDGGTEERALVGLYPPAGELPFASRTPERGTEDSFDETVRVECDGTYILRVSPDFQTIIDGDPGTETASSALQYGVELSVERGTGTPEVVAPVAGEPADGQQGGPVVLVGIDAEDEYCSDANHGPAGVYSDVLRSVASQTQNAGAGVLVIGAGKQEGDTVSRYWQAVAEGAGEPYTFVNGEENIRNASFAGYRVIVVASENEETPDGGLTPEENGALTDRRADIAAFVNAGGGLWGLASPHEAPYGYLADIGAFSFEHPPQFPNITPTAEGERVGISNALDVCCWHDEYTGFPDFLKVLATNPDSGDAVAIGGVRVVLGPEAEPVNLPPVAVDDEDVTRRNEPVTTDVVENDSDPEGDPLAVSVERQPSNGTVSCADGNCTYDPDDGFTGVDTYEYRISDGNGGTDTATVTVEVEAPIPPANRPPVALDDSARTLQGEPVDVFVLRNDSDPDNDPLTLTRHTEPSRGTVECSEGGECAYAPNENYTGTDTFTYTVSDGRGGEDTATVTVRVVAPPEPANRPPDAVNDARSTERGKAVSLNALANDTDPDGDALTLSSNTDPERGTVRCGSRGNCAYAPNAKFTGEDFFRYTIGDGRGGTDTARVTITVAAPPPPPNRAPVARDDEGTTRQGVPVTLAVVANDSDPDGDAIEISANGEAENGAVECYVPIGSCSYSPGEGFVGEDSFTYTISDPDGLTDEATVRITVRETPPEEPPQPANGPPEAVDDEATTRQGQAVSLNVLTNDSDPEGDAMRLTDNTKTEHGVIRCRETGACAYDPEAGFSGRDEYRYDMAARGGEDRARVDIRVEPRAEPPAEEPPVEEPPVEEPPEVDPPVDEPPVDEPDPENPPSVDPPTETPDTPEVPVDEPDPVGPPLEEPPVGEPTPQGTPETPEPDGSAPPASTPPESGGNPPPGIETLPETGGPSLPAVALAAALLLTVGGIVAVRRYTKGGGEA